MVRTSTHRAAASQSTTLWLVLQAVMKPGFPFWPPGLFPASYHPISSLIRSRWVLSLWSFSAWAWSLACSFWTTSAGALARKSSLAIFAVGLGHFFAQFFQFPVQAPGLFLKVDDAGQRHEDFHRIHHGLGRGRWRAGGRIAMEFLDPAQVFDGLLVAVKRLNGPGLRAGEEHFHQGARRHVHLAPDIADGGDGVHDEVHSPLRPRGRCIWGPAGVGRDHDAALGAGQASAKSPR